MTQEADKLLKQALTLPPEDRAAMASSLIESLDTVVDESAESAWQSEIGRRIADLDSGKAKTVPWEEVQRKISAKLKNDR